MKFVTLFLTIILLSACGVHSLKKQGVYQELVGQEYLNYVSDSSVNIIDVRTNSEFKKSHIKGAINISYFGGHFKKELEEAGLEVQKTTLIYCETQHRSLFVVRKLKKAGFNKIIDLDKGMMHWRKDGFPVEI